MDPDEEGEDFDDIENFDDNEDQDQQVEDQQDEEDQPNPDEGEEEIEEQPRRSRAQTRIETLDRELREAREREADLRRQFEELRSGQSRTSAAERERQERERYEQMDPLERAEYRARSVEERTSQAIGALSQQIADSSDRSAFAEACIGSPALAKVKDQVETELAKLRARNINMPRETLAKYLIGEAILKKAPKARSRAEKRAAANLDRERARPAGGASDAPTRGRVNDEKAARDKRLEGFTF